MFKKKIAKKDAIGCVEDWMSSSFYQKLPKYAVVHQDHKAVELFVLQSDSTEQNTRFYDGEEMVDGVVSAGVTTCYPLIKLKPNAAPKRLGNPICDHFALKVQGDRAFFALGDGCSWGCEPKEAAMLACQGFVDFLVRGQAKIKNTTEAGDILLRAVDHATKAIVVGKAQSWMAGTTTLCGGIILPLQRPDKKGNTFAFCCVNVGDCKAFHWVKSKQEGYEVTADNRVIRTDASDPGGRLGPYLDGGKPDLRNLNVHLVTCSEGDVIFLSTDGINDNMDPVFQACKPAEWGLKCPSWMEAMNQNPKLYMEAKAKFYASELHKLFLANGHTGDSVRPPFVIRRLIEYALLVTERSRSWLEEHPNQKLPDNYEQFPGKLDHAAAVAVEVTHFAHNRPGPGPGKGKKPS